MSVLSRESWVSFNIHGRLIFCGKKLRWIDISSTLQTRDGKTLLEYWTTYIDGNKVSGHFSRRDLNLTFLKIFHYTSYKTALLLIYLPNTSLLTRWQAFHLDLNLDGPKSFGFSSVFWMNVSAGFWQTPAAIAGTDILPEIPTWLNTEQHRQRVPSLAFERQTSR